MSAPNLAAWFGFRGSIDTDLKFSEFFFDDHTLMFRCMRQYANAGPGPVIAANNAGTYFVGQGDFRGDYDSGSVGAKFLVVIGDQHHDYSTVEGDKWIHVAIVRSGNTFSVYFDGTRRTETITISPVSPQLPDPNATLRMGRTVDGFTINGRETQFYGYVDDVAVFNRALTHNEIVAIVTERDQRLHAHQPHLVAAWTFDHTLPSGDPLPPRFSRPYQFNSNPVGRRASLALVTESRNDAVDAQILRGILPYQKVEWMLPFDEGDVWEVIQGNNNGEFDAMGKPAGSHFGASAAFAWDFQLRSEPLPGKPANPNGKACGERLHAVAGGNVFDYCDVGGPVDDCPNESQDGFDWFHIELARHEIVTYMHTLIGSIKEMHPNIPPPPPPKWAAGFPVSKGEVIARVGSRCVNNCHLHIASQSANPNAFLSDPITPVTFPVAFSHYEMCPAGFDFTLEHNWTSVDRGIPLVGQFVRRPKI
jgi:Concanavalin A-like lectin/glucanases superfamily